MMIERQSQPSASPTGAALHHSGEENDMGTLTMRSKITVRWTTAPSDMGYDGRPTGWREGRGETMSLRRAANFPYELQQKIGQGVYHLIEYRHRGMVIDPHEIHEVLAEAEYRETQRR